MTENRRRWIWISGVAAVFVLLIGLLTWLLTASDGAARSPQAVTPPSPTATTPKPSPTPKHKATSTPLPPGPTFEPGTAPGYGYGVNAGRHRLVLEMFSSQPVYVQMGWKVPTGSSGKYAGHTASWSQSMTVYGRPDYAEFFIYYGGANAPVSCRVYVDGSLRAEKTTSGAYGALMCVG